MTNVTDSIGPEQCSHCGTYELCDCKPLIPTTPGPGRWDENDWVCPGGTQCDCEAQE